MISTISLLQLARIPSRLTDPRTFRTAEALGIKHIGDVACTKIDDLICRGLSLRAAERLLDAVNRLIALPGGRLRAIGRFDEFDQYHLPDLSAAQICSLCYAHSVDDEILALFQGDDERNRDMVLLRWGYRSGERRTLEEIGDKFNLTRERARQIVQARLDMIQSAGVTLPLASSLVADLNEGGGAAPMEHFRVLLRHGPVAASDDAIAILPVLSELGCVPYLNYHPEFDLWVTSQGESEWIQSGRAALTKRCARKTINSELRAVGAVSPQLLDGLSQFGRDHAVNLVRPANSTAIVHAGFVAFDPAADTILLRAARKTLSVTPAMQLTDLHVGLRHIARLRSISEDLLRWQLARSGDFAVSVDLVASVRPLRRESELSAAECAAVELFERSGNAMLFRDYVAGMGEAGFSLPMANILLRRPYVRSLGLAWYALRGRIVDENARRRFSDRRRELRRQGRLIVSVTRLSSGDVEVLYQLTEFSLQGVLTVPSLLRGCARDWRAQFSDGTNEPVRVGKGFIWRLRSFFERAKVKPGDRLRATFSPTSLTVTFERISSEERVQDVARPRSRHEQLVRALFDNAI